MTDLKLSIFLYVALMCLINVSCTLPNFQPTIFNYNRYRRSRAWSTSRSFNPITNSNNALDFVSTLIKLASNELQLFLILISFFFCDSSNMQSLFQNEIRSEQKNSFSVIIKIIRRKLQLEFMSQAILYIEGHYH